MYTMNLGRGSKRKGVGEVVGKVVYSMNLGRGSKRKGRGESTSTDCLSSTYVARKGETMKNKVRTSVTN